MHGNTKIQANDLEYELNRLSELSTLIRKDASMLTRELQEEIIDLLIRTRDSKESLKVSEIRDEAVRVLTWVASK
ncbi:hypothetical protein A9R01_14095 ['Osedax' symbiont bacterium Rs2_46_30_T18]|nr:hypothetical protein A9R01_14095 ['Osedax' symbiont bacterium Rs2_46_30_T18]